MRPWVVGFVPELMPRKVRPKRTGWTFIAGKLQRATATPRWHRQGRPPTRSRRTLTAASVVAFLSPADQCETFLRRSSQSCVEGSVDDPAEPCNWFRFWQTNIPMADGVAYSSSVDPESQWRMNSSRRRRMATTKPIETIASLMHFYCRQCGDTYWSSCDHEPVSYSSAPCQE